MASLVDSVGAGTPLRSSSSLGASWRRSIEAVAQLGLADPAKGKRGRAPVWPEAPSSDTTASTEEGGGGGSDASLPSSELAGDDLVAALDRAKAAEAAAAVERRGLEKAMLAAQERAAEAKAKAKEVVKKADPVVAPAAKPAAKPAADPLSGTAIITMAAGIEAGRQAVVLMQSLRDVKTKVPHLLVMLTPGGRDEPIIGRIVPQDVEDALARLKVETVVIEPIPETEYTSKIAGGRAVFWGMAL